MGASLLTLRRGSPAEAQRRGGGEGRDLEITRLTASEAGRYSVILDNGLGRVTNAVAEVTLDLPLAASPTVTEVNGGRFRLMLTGNPGQRVAVDRFDTLETFADRQEDWLGAQGLIYEDDSPSVQPWRFYRYGQVPLNLVPDGALTDGRRAWRVRGGRLGRSYVLEASGDGGQSWMPIQTNAVQAGPYHFTPSANDRRQFRVKE